MYILSNVQQVKTLSPETEAGTNIREILQPKLK